MRRGSRWVKLLQTAVARNIPLSPGPLGRRRGQLAHNTERCQDLPRAPPPRCGRGGAGMWTPRKWRKRILRPRVRALRLLRIPDMLPSVGQREPGAA